MFLFLTITMNHIMRKIPVSKKLTGIFVNIGPEYTLVTWSPPWLMLKYNLPWPENYQMYLTLIPGFVTKSLGI